MSVSSTEPRGARRRSVLQLVADAGERCTPAERRVAEVVVSDPELVAFGTVAEVAARAGTSGATVVRLAGRLGFDGFPDLQTRVQGELSRRLRPATERIREADDEDVVGRTLQSALHTVHSTLDAVDRQAFDATVRLLSSGRRPVVVICGDEADGIGAHAVTRLSMVRGDVAHLSGSPVRAGRVVGRLASGCTVVALDFSRYDRWLLDAVRAAGDQGATVVALTDSPLSPLASLADHLFVVGADGPGPFDSYVGACALVEALCSGVARRLRASATGDLDRIDRLWRAWGALVED